MRLCVFTRLLTAAGTVLLAAPAFGQADLAVTLDVAADADLRTAGVPVGGTATFDITVTNNGPTHVTEFQLDATKDAALAYPTDVAGAFIPVSGCTPLTSTQTAPFPCKVSIPTGLLSGSSTTLSFDLEYPAPSPLNPGTAACPSNPGPAPTYVTTVTVSNAQQEVGATTTPVTDPTPANNVGTFTTHLRDWADLEVVSLDGPANTGEGQSITYTTVVRNNGPCLAPRVRVVFNYPATLAFDSSTVCTNASLGDDGFCTLGDIAKSESKTFTATFHVNTYPKSIFEAAIPVDVQALSRTRSASAGPPPVAAAPATDDPNGKNDTAATSAKVDLSSNKGGCATGAAGTLLALLPLLALRFRRRRA